VNDALHEKYSRQILFAGIGEQGQQRLLAASAVVVGCGAIGAATGNLLTRAGVGKLRHYRSRFRRTLQPSGAKPSSTSPTPSAALPKAVAAERKLRAINSGVSIEGIVADLSPRNAADLLARFDLILDGTDNFETRFLINDFAVQNSKPWIYAAAVASYGLSMTIRPRNDPPCLGLFNGYPASPSLEETCDTIGVLGPHR